jgi:hypothetical protein
VDRCERIGGLIEPGLAGHLTRSAFKLERASGQASASRGPRQPAQALGPGRHRLFSGTEATACNRQIHRADALRDGFHDRLVLVSPRVVVVTDAHGVPLRRGFEADRDDHGHGVQQRERDM